MVLFARTSVTDQSVDWLRTQVRDGLWPIGTKIPPEAELAQELGVARNTIREAVRALVHTGVLEIRRGAGTFVRSETEVDAVFARRLLQAEPADTADLRRAIEGEATRLACRRRTEEDIVNMRRALEHRAAAMNGDGDRTAFVNTDYRFHQIVVQAAHNDLFDELFRCLAAEVKAPIDEQAARSTAEQRNQAHYDVVDAIAARDEAAALRAAIIHLNVSANRLLKKNPGRR